MIYDNATRFLALCTAALLSVICCLCIVMIRGHGTFVGDNHLCASVAGVVERVNRLISVHQYKSRSVSWKSFFYELVILDVTVKLKKTCISAAWILAFVVDGIVQHSPLWVRICSSMVVLQIVALTAVSTADELKWIDRHTVSKEVTESNVDILSLLSWWLVGHGTAAMEVFRLLMCQRCVHADPSVDTSASFLSVCGHVRNLTCSLNEVVNCTYAMSAKWTCSKVAIFDFLVNVAQNVSNVSAVTYFLFWWRQLTMQLTMQRGFHHWDQIKNIYIPQCFYLMGFQLLGYNTFCLHQSHFDATNNLQNGNYNSYMPAYQA